MGMKWGTFTLTAPFHVFIFSFSIGHMEPLMINPRKLSGHSIMCLMIILIMSVSSENKKAELFLKTQPSIYFIISYSASSSV